MKGAVGKLSEFINANPEGLVFVKNTTEGVNQSKSLDLKPGDEIIDQSQLQACWNAVDFVTEGQTQRPS